jgi:hypothetical protein
MPKPALPSNTLSALPTPLRLFFFFVRSLFVFARSRSLSLLQAGVIATCDLMLTALNKFGECELIRMLPFVFHLQQVTMMSSHTQTKRILLTILFVVGRKCTKQADNNWQTTQKVQRR